jgi:hypothetical protein
VESQVKLTAVRYVESPWFDADTGEQVSLAYIDRDEAWAIYEKTVQNQTAAFLELWQAAETDPEPLGQALRFLAAEKFAQGEEFIAVWDFAVILHPDKAREHYRATGDAVAALPQKIYTARQNAAVFVDCPQDYEGLVHGAAVKALTAEGFTIVTDRDKAATIYAVRIDEGLQQVLSGNMYYPSLTANLSGKTGPLFSFTINGPRQGAITAEVAKRRAYTGLAAALVESFPVEINKTPSKDRKGSGLF